MLSMSAACVCCEQLKHGYTFNPSLPVEYAQWQLEWGPLVGGTYGRDLLSLGKRFSNPHLNYRSQVSWDMTFKEFAQDCMHLNKLFELFYLCLYN